VRILAGIPVQKNSLGWNNDTSPVLLKYFCTAFPLFKEDYRDRENIVLLYMDAKSWHLSKFFTASSGKISKYFIPVYFFCSFTCL